MDYLIRFIQLHETFRKPEIDALAELKGVQLHWISYSENVRRHVDSYAERRRSRDIAMIRPCKRRLRTVMEDR